MKTYLITGAAGFIGSNFVDYILKTKEDVFLVLQDKLTYAGNLENLKDYLNNENVEFIKGDIANEELVDRIFVKYNIDYVVNFAAESHVDRSIENPRVFLETNILGTQVLLEKAKKFWQVSIDENGYPVYLKGKKFLQISTDEVYGSLDIDFKSGRTIDFNDEKLNEIVKNRKDVKSYGNDFFIETTSLSPKSPYSASKTSADLMVLAYYHTYGLPVNITRCSNNYGEKQFPEKLIPLIITKVLKGEKLPVYGTGENVRDWLYVKDHCKAVSMVLENGRCGEIYNIGGFNEETNINIVKLIIDTIYEIMVKEENMRKYLKTDLENVNYNLITFVKDRLGHDLRYGINPLKIVRELGFYPETSFKEGILKTIKWYLYNSKWIESVNNLQYRNYYDEFIKTKKLP